MAVLYDFRLSILIWENSPRLSEFILIGKRIRLNSNDSLSIHCFLLFVSIIYFINATLLLKQNKLFINLNKLFINFGCSLPMLFSAFSHHSLFHLGNIILIFIQIIVILRQIIFIFNLLNAKE